MEPPVCKRSVSYLTWWRVSQHPDLIVEIRNRVNQLKQDIGLNMVEINIEISKFQNHANMVGAVYAFHNKPEDYLITQTAD